MSEKRITANRRNALKSTGPKTPEGKAKTSMNALKHGLRSASMAVPVLENPEDWEVHRSLVVRDLNPVGYLETILAERAAAMLWRLGRVVRYESAVVSNAINDVGKVSGPLGDFDEDSSSSVDLKRAKEDAETLARVRGLKPKDHVDGEDAGTVLSLVLGALDLDEKEDVEATCPNDHHGEHWGDWDGWTRETLEVAVLSLRDQAAAEYARVDPWEEALKEAKSAVILAQVAQEDHAARLNKERGEALLPPEETLEKVSRYETTLERSLFRTIHELHRLQATREGEPLLPPAAVDVDLST